MARTKHIKQTSKASDTLIRRLNQYARALRTKPQFRKRNRVPATAIGVENGQVKEVDHSAPCLEPLVPKLKRQLLKIAPIGQPGLCEFSVGSCCEVHASNKLFKKRPSVRIDELVFTDAIRPTTGQIIARCANCKAVFG